MEPPNTCMAGQFASCRAVRRTALAAVLPLFVVACGGTMRPPVATAPPVPDTTAPVTPTSDRISRAALDAIPRYEGVWSGMYVRQQCHEAGGAVGVACQRLPDEQRLLLRLTQTGSEAEGVLVLGPVEADVSGAVRADGTLTLRGRRSTPTHTITVTGWRSTADGVVMQGTFRYSVRPQDNRLGTVTITAALEDMVKDPGAG